MIDVRFYYSFYLHVRPVFPFQDLGYELQELIAQGIKEGSIVRGCVVEDHDGSCRVIVIGGTPLQWRSLNAHVTVIEDSDLASNLLDMFALVAEHIDKKGKKEE